jgi:hypothetical protein
VYILNVKRTLVELSMMNSGALEPSLTPILYYSPSSIYRCIHAWRYFGVVTVFKKFEANVYIYK